jgi:NO-binding membrane sensor protein with MHYT domain
MTTLGQIVPLAFREGIAALSYVVAALGSYVALQAATRIYGGRRVHLGYVAVAAFAMGGVGIWSMHFIGMQAQVVPFTVGYDVPLTVLSFVVGVGMSGTAFWYVGRTRFAATRCLVGGTMAGLGVAAMHYIGMAAMDMPAQIAWDPLAIVGSVVIAIVAATVALWMAFNIQTEWQRPFAALVMAVAVCGMHYTSVAGGTVICTAAREAGGWQLGGESLPYVVFALSALALVAIRWQLHRTSEQYRAGLAARMDALLDAGDPGLLPVARGPGAS